MKRSLEPVSHIQLTNILQEPVHNNRRIFSSISCTLEKEV
jgi:hypothetical protein